MAQGSFRITARVPVSVRVNEQQIFCNSTKGYRLSAHNVVTGEVRLLEEHVGATIKANPYKLEPDEKWVIEAL